MKIIQCKESRINQLDKTKIEFGTLFTDHMCICDYKSGKWQEASIVPLANWSLPPGLSVFHYGQCVFEGMKAYKDKRGGIWLFRPEENAKRLNNSARRLKMPEFPEDLFVEMVKKIVELDREWVPGGIENSLYIRPFMIATQNRLLATSSEEFRFSIICCPAGKYYSKPLNLTIASKFSRAASGGVGFAKAGGNYAASFYPTSLAVKAGFDQVVWTDAATHTYIEEVGTMNILFRIDNTIYTAPVGNTILDGITRKSAIQILLDLGYSVKVEPILIEKIKQAHNDGTLKEVFGVGTAVAVCNVKSFYHNNTTYNLPNIDQNDSVVLMLKEKILGVQYNEIKDPYGWRVRVC